MCSEKKSDQPPRISLKERIRKLLTLNSTPREIAFGVAIGVFIGITPLIGFHTVMVVLAALLIKRANKIAILLGTNISTTPTFPFITWAGYSIGNFVLGQRYPPLQWSTFAHLSFKAVCRAIRDIYFPLFIGSIILGLLLAVVFYYLTLWFIMRRKRAKAAALLAQKNPHEN